MNEKQLNLQNPIINKHLRNWISLQHLMFWDIGRQFLSDGHISECENITDRTKCISNDKCKYYKSNSQNKYYCVSKKRILTVSEKFSKDKLPIIKTFNNGIKQYKILNISNVILDKDTIYVNEEADENNENGENGENGENEPNIITVVVNENRLKISYCIFQSMNGRDDTLYILFSSGYVLFNNMGSEKLHEWIDDLIENFIIKQETPICLCGFSLGCVISQLVGLKIIEKYPDWFEKWCFVLGAGPFKWIDPDPESGYLNLYNRFSYKFYIFVLIIPNSNKNLVRIDHIFYEGHEYLVQPKHILLLQYHKNQTNNTDTIEYSNNEITKTEYNTGIQYAFLHEWNNYKDTLLRDLPVHIHASTKSKYKSKITIFNGINKYKSTSNKITKSNNSNKKHKTIKSQNKRFHSI
jgi:hypothetical protein